MALTLQKQYLIRFMKYRLIFLVIYEIHKRDQKQKFSNVKIAGTCSKHRAVED
jgi:hypothetical protein